MYTAGPEGQRGHATCDLMLGPNGEWQILLLNFVPLDIPQQQSLLHRLLLLLLLLLGCMGSYRFASFVRK